MGEIKIGESLKRIREEKNLKQEYVAESLKISKPAVSKYENNKANPSYEVLIKLANLYDVSLDDIFSRDMFIVSEEDENYYLRVSKNMIKFVNNLLKDDYSRLLNYILNDPDQSIKLIASKMKDYI